MDYANFTSIWAWAADLAILAGCLVTGLSFARFARDRIRRLEEQGEHVVAGIVLSGLARTVPLALLATGLYAAGLVLLGGRLPDLPLVHFWLNVCMTLVALAGAWFVYRLVDVAVFYLDLRAHHAGAGLNLQIVPVVRRLLQLLTIVLTVLFVAQNIFKWEIGALLAGLGIGGLAVALAAQQTLSNLFGSITIFADRPFALNDTVRVKGYTGTVQDVGFRSTRLRTPDGTVVTIPNAVVAGEVVESLGSRPGLYHEINLPLKSDTPPAKIARAVEAARQLLRRHRERLLQTPPPRANLTALGPGSCTVNIAYWFASAEPESFHHFNHDFHMDLLAHLAEDAVALA